MYYQLASFQKHKNYMFCLFSSFQSEISMIVFFLEDVQANLRNKTNPVEIIYFFISFLDFCSFVVLKELKGEREGRFKEFRKIFCIATFYTKKSKRERWGNSLTPLLPLRVLLKNKNKKLDIYFVFFIRGGGVLPFLCLR